MATSSLQAESANTAETIRNLATEIQSLCSQMRSLGEAIADDAFHHGCSGANAYNFATLITRIAEEAATQGEEVEKLAMGLRLA